jgi:HD-like signal output (HDOD) protein
LYDQFVHALDDPNVQLPQMSVVVQQVLMMLSASDVDLRKAADTAGKDPALAADVLRLVNSAAYRGVTEITRLDLAFARLGQRAVRSLLLASTAKEVAISIGGAHRTVGEQLWRCSVASGVILGRMAGRYGLKEEEAFLVGLLHDIGTLAILKIIHDFQRKSGQRITRALFDCLCHHWHEHMGLRLADAWNLPDPLPEICGNHHRAPASDDPLEKHRLLVGFADVVCAMLRYKTYVPYDFFHVPSVQRLGLTDTPETHELLRSLPKVIKQQMDCF